MALTAWSSIAGTEYDQDSPLTTTLLTKIRDRLLHLKQVAYGDGDFEGRYPHAHRGIEDAAVFAPHSGNMLADFAPHSSRYDAWTVSNYTAQTSGLRTTTTPGDSAYQTIPDANGSYRPFGTTGADFCVSIFVKAVSSLPTTGELWFGLSVNAPTGYATSCKGVIPHSSITTSWKRFHMMLSAKCANAASSVAFLLKNGTTAYDEQVYITACDVRVGQTLCYPEPGILEITNNRGHRLWTTYGGLTDCPIWDRTVAITQSTSITGA